MAIGLGHPLGYFRCNDCWTWTLPLEFSPLSCWCKKRYFDFWGRPRIVTRTVPTGSQGAEISMGEMLCALHLFTFLSYFYQGLPWPRLTYEFPSNSRPHSGRPRCGRPQTPWGIKCILCFLSPPSVLGGWSLHVYSTNLWDCVLKIKSKYPKTKQKQTDPSSSTEKAGSMMSPGGGAKITPKPQFPDTQFWRNPTKGLLIILRDLQLGRAMTTRAQNSSHVWEGADGLKLKQKVISNKWKGLRNSSYHELIISLKSNKHTKQLPVTIGWCGEPNYSANYQGHGTIF